MHKLIVCMVLCLGGAPALLTQVSCSDHRPPSDGTARADDEGQSDTVVQEHRPDGDPDGVPDRTPTFKGKPPDEEAASRNHEDRPEKEVQLHRLGAEPDGLPEKTPTKVSFTVLLTGTDTPPDNLSLQQVDERGNVVQTLGQLVDDGTKGDSARNDGIYSGHFSICAQGEARLYYRAQFRHEEQDYSSGTCSITVTSFPVAPAPSDPNFIVTDPNTAKKFYSNEIIIAFVEGTPASRIREILDEREAPAVGAIPSLHVLQLRISGDGTAAGVHAAIKALVAYKEVQYAEPNYVAELD